MTWLAVIGTVLSILLIVLQQVFSSKREAEKKAQAASTAEEEAVKAQALRERVEAQEAVKERDRLVAGEAEFDRILNEAKKGK